MTYWQLLECPDYAEINAEIDNYISNLGIVETSTEFWNPVDAKQMIKICRLFNAYLLSQKILISSISVTVGKHPNCCGIHIDTPPARFKFSWPVRNTQDTYNRWFERIVPDAKVITNRLGGMSFIDVNELREVARVEYLKPMIIDAGIPHDVYIGDLATFPRIGLQCQLFREPTSL